MGLAELVLLAVGLSMDAFAVSICKGLGMKKINLKVAVVLGLFFGGFQAGMPVIGWALGSQFMSIIGPIDHWIAFILLAFIGGKMLWEAFTEDEDEGNDKDAEKIDLGEYLILAIATSIDALAVGISFPRSRSTSFPPCRSSESRPSSSLLPAWQSVIPLARVTKNPPPSWAASCSSSSGLRSYLSIWGFSRYKKTPLISQCQCMGLMQSFA